MSDLTIESIEVWLCEFHLPDLGLDPSGFSIIYEPGGVKKVKAFVTQIKTNEDIVVESFPFGPETLRSLSLRLTETSLGILIGFFPTLDITY